MRTALLALLFASFAAGATAINGVFTTSGSLSHPVRRIQQNEKWDSRPIAWMFFSNGGCRNGSMEQPNKEGYTRPSNGLDCIADTTDHEAFLTAVMTRLNALLGNMDTFVPRPAGVLIWDIEGAQALGSTYIGHPSVLPDMTVNGDAVFDDIIEVIKSRGYRIGFTLRPGVFRIGPELPPCHDNFPSDGRFQYFWLAEPATVRGWWCNGTEWVTEQQAATELGHSVSGNSFTSTLWQGVEIMTKDITYAINRWGASYFYIDSTYTVPPGQVNGNNMPGFVWEEIQRRFPSIQFFPENVSDRRDVGRWASEWHEPANTWMGSWTGRYDPVTVPIQCEAPEEGVYENFTEFVRKKSIILIDPWCVGSEPCPNGNCENLNVKSIYEDAGYR